MSNEIKLAVLRAKTDRDLLILMQRELERGLTLADVAATKGSPFHVQAEKAYQTVKTWLPKITGLSRDQRRALGLGLKELETALDWLSADEMNLTTGLVSSRRTPLYR